MGRVADGMGAAAELTTLWSCVSDAVGVELLPGSLNVELSVPLDVGRLVSQRVDVGLATLAVVPCRIEEVDCFLVVDANAEPRAEGLETIEIAAPVSLRTKLGLRSGDQVVVRVG